VEREKNQLSGNQNVVMETLYIRVVGKKPAAR